MQIEPEHEVTRLLSLWQNGDHEAGCLVIGLVEAELRRLARNYMRRERSGHTLQPTVLINEAWMRLAPDAAAGQVRFNGRSHFVALAAEQMRRILVEHARARKAAKRGGPDIRRQPLDTEIELASEISADLVRIDDGISDLARVDYRAARIVELHFFGGLTYEELAEHLSIGRSTVIRDLKMALLFLRNYLSSLPPEG